MRSRISAGVLALTLVLVTVGNPRCLPARMLNAFVPLRGKAIPNPGSVYIHVVNGVPLAIRTQEQQERLRAWQGDPNRVVFEAAELDPVTTRRMTGLWAPTAREVSVNLTWRERSRLEPEFTPVNQWLRADPANIELLRSMQFDALRAFSGPTNRDPQDVWNKLKSQLPLSVPPDSDSVRISASQTSPVWWGYLINALSLGAVGVLVWNVWRSRRAQQPRVSV
ncbi:MAG: hypothetical protein AAGD00_05930 [Planctomycetota bacterium]